MGVDLKNLQANILKAHGREHAWCLFFQFNNSPFSLRRWVSGFAPQVTTAYQQANDSERRKSGFPDFDGGTLVSFFLSGTGYYKMGFQNEQPQDPAFQRGMKNGATCTLLNDIESSQWEENYRQDLDALIMLADNSLEKLERRKNDLAQSLEANMAGKLIFVEKGKMLQPDGVPLEHFGFVDGISQPELWDAGGKPLEDNWRRWVLAQEDGENFGSYLVFRKLEQNVEAFSQKVTELAHIMKVSGELVKAQVIGRFPNGMPLALAEQPSLPNDFAFINNGDRSGLKCPFHSHIRKVNPRDMGLPNSEDRRIVRRGISYDEFGRKPDLSDEPNTGVGMLFMCYQKSIEDQFEFIQKEWCNNPDYPEPKTGIDPIAGQPYAGDKPQHWNKGWNTRRNKQPFGFSEVVRLKGGEYFYAPSLSFLREPFPKHGVNKSHVAAPVGGYPQSRRIVSLGRGGRYGA